MLRRSQVVLTTCHHRLTTCVCCGQSRLPQKDMKFKISEWTTKINCIFNYLNLITTYILWLLAEIAVFVDQVRHLFLQPIVFLHQKLVHRSQLSIDSLQSRRLFPLLFSTPVTNSQSKRKKRDGSRSSFKKANPKLIQTDLRFWNQTLICFGSMFERIGHSRMSCCRRIELGFGHSW